TELGTLSQKKKKTESWSRRLATTVHGERKSVNRREGSGDPHRRGGAMGVMGRLRVFVVQEPVVAASCIIAGFGVIFFPWPAHLVEFQLPEGICSKSEGDMYCPAYAQFIKCHSLSTVIVNMACTFMCTCWSYYHDNIQSW
ncbi:hypothetical protein E2562_011593, partial [Oryza meyeriana var. granulata]